MIRFQIGPSLTYWMRGEPDPRSDATDALIVPLQARVRDPMWFLTRQWQLGEFQGADAGSPAYAALTELTGQLSAWSVTGAAPTPLGAAPLEREAFTPDLATRVELGQTFERLLTEHTQAGLIGDFRTAYAIASVPVDPSDDAEVRFRSVVGDRAIDGIALASAFAASAPALPPAPSVPGPAQSDVLAALNDFASWIANTIGVFGTTDPVAWAPDRLEYALTISGTGPTGQPVSLTATPGSDGMLDWPAFDLIGSRQVPASRGASNGKGKTRAIIPAHVRFRGAPNARFWDFEMAGTDLGSMIPDKRDLARLAVMDFVLLHSNDWFLVPIDMAPGTMHEIAQLVVHDVFGVTTAIGRADRQPDAVGNWSMFATSIAGGPPATTADFFVLPSSAASAIQTGPVIEEVQFGRDEMANMVWGLEQETENALGQAWSGHERDIVRNMPPPGATPPPPPLPGVGLRYVIQNRVPEYWIPFLAVSIDPAAGSVALERSAMLRDDGTPIEPAGRILKPSSIAAGAPYRVPEEEIARTGVLVQRVVSRCRWVDGGTALWTMRRRGPGPGEVSSALQFDQAIVTP
jgi:hypothetical protein